ncbi:dynamin-like 120 kDa protein, mitochondrial isoform X2 [Toxorhynchites rutilus septentrionalis]|uniref:dynamin-like 120 kDa protein, mitochondrial isoform X2 n=1 Tax=Toxorhynchites rutilus septentrionalis TaxID=329112 RepID=UPI00247996EE|nr:dynamin-like 120 kDa protein, mitochondrial isoform X2 [Toxorhynchites rutilus septentrionalis]
MAQLLRGRTSINPRFKHIQPVCALSRVNFSGFTFGGNNNGQKNRFQQQQEFLRRPNFGGYQYYQSSRGYGMLVGRVLRGLLKLRYVVLGGAIGGGVTLNKRYEEWKDGLPDMKWLDDVLPDNEKWAQFSRSLIAMKDSVKDSIEIDPRLKQLSENKMNEWRQWFDQRLDNAIEAAETQHNPQIESSFQNMSEFISDLYGATKEEIRSQNTVNAKSLSPEENRKRVEMLQSQVDTLQTEIMNVQLKYQREIEKLEKENRDLRQQYLILKTNRKQPTKKRIKKSLIDMYSEVLDELSGYDTSYTTADHLPRVVVVGDQSSGKTSVLEAIAQARIFPRGSGEMMTRAPVKVTLSEGPYHVAQFRDSDREYDLTKESDLAELRRDVEIRMRNSVRGGKTVSMDVISMTVKGPGLQRMVLVDLPGIISTQTVDMAADTKDSIRHMTEHFMSNPNAIILCIQDGSVDAERSNVTDMVSQCDPLGKRTIFVLTKVDMAEDLADPNRIRKILSGKLFPMKALGYFAVVTGRGRKDDSIETIREYEEKFFKNSKLFQSGVTMSHQVTTRNLSLAVADRFWKMVRETIEQQADAFKATRFNLETEWKNNFPRLRESGRDELFEKAKGEVLDEVVNLSQVSAKKWEELLNNKLWEKLSNYVFENIYLPAAQSGSENSFNTMVDIKLRQWAEQALPAKSVEAGWEALQKEFQHLMEVARRTPDHDDLYDNLKSAVIDESIRRHSWEDKAIDMLRVIQLNTLEDRSVHDKQEWDQAVRFFESSVREKLQQTEQTIGEMFGPSMSQRWFQWRYSTIEQNKRKQVKGELDKILSSDTKHSPTLSYDELTTVRKNLQRNNVEVETDYIRETWYPIYRRHFLQQALHRAYDCRKAYFLYAQQGAECHVNCSDVVLFWRIQQVIKVTANALRQQVINREARRLDKEIKEVLDEYGEDDEKKQQLLTGKRVTLAEELIRVRHIQEKLEEFINALNQEK